MLGTSRVEKPTAIPTSNISPKDKQVGRRSYRRSLLRLKRAVGSGWCGQSRALGGKRTRIRGEIR